MASQKHTDDIQAYNRRAWDQQVHQGNRWTVPVSRQTIAAASQGQWNIVLTPQKVVPPDWFPPLDHCETLCLACGGGQQGPVLSAAGANVTVLDNSPMQLKQDQAVAKRDGLSLRTHQGDMRELSVFTDATFDLVFQPCSLSFVPDVKPVFAEVFRVLKPGGVYLLGACNPILFLFDAQSLTTDKPIARHAIPYSDTRDLPASELEQLKLANEPLCHGHSLDSLIGDQLTTGFYVTGFYEDILGGDENALDSFIPTTFATRAVKPHRNSHG